MAGDFRAHFDDAVRAAEEARHGDSNDDESEALWEAIDAAAAAAALADAAEQLAAAGVAPTGSWRPIPA